ncbi:MAG TPA: hypothetical protein VMD75_04090 [Candidatus Binataceae bacterium]|nr:hypothetical protein [Candidatus Binataceae bacterium]
MPQHLVVRNCSRTQSKYEIQLVKFVPKLVKRIDYSAGIAGFAGANDFVGEAARRAAISELFRQ